MQDRLIEEVAALSALPVEGVRESMEELAKSFDQVSRASRAFPAEPMAFGRALSERERERRRRARKAARRARRA